MDGRPMASALTDSRWVAWAVMIAWAVMGWAVIDWATIDLAMGS